MFAASRAPAPNKRDHSACIALGSAAAFCRCGRCRRRRFIFKRCSFEKNLHSSHPFMASSCSITTASLYHAALMCMFQGFFSHFNFYNIIESFCSVQVFAAAWICSVLFHLPECARIPHTLFPLVVTVLSCLRSSFRICTRAAA